MVISHEYWSSGLALQHLTLLSMIMIYAHNHRPSLKADMSISMIMVKVLLKLLTLSLCLRK